MVSMIALPPDKMAEARRAYKRAWAARNSDRVRQYRKTRYRRHADKIGAANKAWRDRNPEKARKLCRKHNWLRDGIVLTTEQYDAMLAVQGGCCKICGIHESELIKSLHADHSHLTGQIRGLVCQRCNSMLGFARDNPDVLRCAAAYLEAVR